jgi:uroporphyrinogen-III synthase
MDRATGPAVVLTRQHEDNQELAAALAARGVVVREIPCLATRYLSPQQPITNNPDAMVFTSRHGVRGFFQQERAGSCCLASPGGARIRSAQPSRTPAGGPLLGITQHALIAAVGKATAKEIQSCGLAVDLIADPPEGAVLANLLKKALPAGSRLLMVRGNLRASEIDTILKNAGYQLEDLIVYENVDVPIPTLQPFPVAAVFIASPSAAKRLLAAHPWMRDARMFTIGRTTAQDLKRLGAVNIEEIGTDPHQWIEVLVRAYQEAANPME